MPVRTFNHVIMSYFEITSVPTIMVVVYTPNEITYWIPANQINQFTDWCYCHGFNYWIHYGLNENTTPSDLAVVKGQVVSGVTTPSLSSVSDVTEKFAVSAMPDESSYLTVDEELSVSDAEANNLTSAIPEGFSDLVVYEESSVCTEKGPVLCGGSDPLNIVSDSEAKNSTSHQQPAGHMFASLSQLDGLVSYAFSFNNCLSPLAVHNLRDATGGNCPNHLFSRLAKLSRHASSMNDPHTLDQIHYIIGSSTDQPKEVTISLKVPFSALAGEWIKKKPNWKQTFCDYLSKRMQDLTLINYSNIESTCSSSSLKDFLDCEVTFTRPEMNNPAWVFFTRFLLNVWNYERNQFGFSEVMIYAGFFQDIERPDGTKKYNSFADDQFGFADLLTFPWLRSRVGNRAEKMEFMQIGNILVDKEILSQDATSPLFETWKQAQFPRETPDDFTPRGELDHLTPEERKNVRNWIAVKADKAAKTAKAAKAKATAKATANQPPTSQPAKAKRVNAAKEKRKLAEETNAATASKSVIVKPLNQIESEMQMIADEYIGCYSVASNTATALRKKNWADSDSEDE